MNKRGELTVWEELLKAIPAIMVLLLLIWAGVRIWNATHPEKYPTEQKDLMRIKDEIIDLNVGDNLAVPVFSQGWALVAENTVNPETKKAYKGCSSDYCVCLKKGSEMICETFNLRAESYKQCGDYKGVSISSSVNLNKTVTVQRPESCRITFSS